MTSFITGSQVYGTPTSESDIDLAVLVTMEDGTKLWNSELRDKTSSSVRFGKLNLIIFHDPVQFYLWKRVTDNLISRKPVKRSDAVEAFKRAGFTRTDYINGFTKIGD